LRGSPCPEACYHNFYLIGNFSKSPGNRCWISLDSGESRNPANTLDTKKRLSPFIGSSAFLFFPNNLSLFGYFKVRVAEEHAKACHGTNTVIIISETAHFFLPSVGGGTVHTGTGEFLTTFSVTLPKGNCPFLPLVAITTTSTPSFSMVSKIFWAGSPTSTNL
jgi:hypothetical protein